MTDFRAFFEDYADGYNQALADKPDYDRIRNYFTDEFLAVGPEGVKGGKNDETFAETLKKGYAFYRAIRTRKMTVLRVEATPIDAAHDMVRAFFRADNERADGSALSIDFDLVYMLQTIGGASKIFAFVAGDEMGLYKRLGLVDDKGQPV